MRENVRSIEEQGVDANSHRKHAGGSQSLDERLFA